MGKSFVASPFFFQEKTIKSNVHIKEEKSSITINEFLRGIKDVLSHKIILSTSIVQASQYFAFGIVESYIILYANSLHFEAWMRA